MDLKGPVARPSRAEEDPSPCVPYVSFGRIADAVACFAGPPGAVTEQGDRIEPAKPEGDPRPYAQTSDPYRAGVTVMPQASITSARGVMGSSDGAHIRRIPGRARPTSPTGRGCPRRNKG